MEVSKVNIFGGGTTESKNNFVVMQSKNIGEKIIKGVSELFNELKDFLWGIGFFGWQIAFVYGLYVSFTYKVSYGFLFLVLFLTSGFINEKILKNLIFDLRPSNSTPFLHTEVFKKKTNGMPSGHAQQTAFALTYSYLLTRKYLYESFALFIITVVQRYLFNNHTIPQLIAGGFFGIILGILFYYIVIRLEKRS